MGNLVSVYLERLPSVQINSNHMVTCKYVQTNRCKLNYQIKNKTNARMKINFVIQMMLRYT